MRFPQGECNAFGDLPCGSADHDGGLASRVNFLYCYRKFNFSAHHFVELDSGKTIAWASGVGDHVGHGAKIVQHHVTYKGWNCLLASTMPEQHQDGCPTVPAPLLVSCVPVQACAAPCPILRI